MADRYPPIGPSSYDGSNEPDMPPSSLDDCMARSGAVSFKPEMIKADEARLLAALSWLNRSLLNEIKSKNLTRAQSAYGKILADFRSSHPYNHIKVTELQNCLDRVYCYHNHCS